ncbi:2Fe-2S iron-sulfur cluster-binding protein [Massilia jejuensis]|uniref:2Fe-2S iron-sulfur cluster-binding protein n=1 Tax=Massilia jejuensis TaxID=648894 RepID=A0ABW0PD81_9BURK
MSHWLRRLHKWAGVLLAIQFTLWMASGVAMSLLDANEVQGRAFRVKPPVPPAWPATVLGPDAVVAAAGESVMAISSGWLLERPVYRLQNGKRSWLVDAASGADLAIDARLAQDIARASYAGPGKAGPARLQAPTLETRSHKEQVWRVDFDDSEATSVYVSARSGNVLEHRNSTWRVFDFFWMLHIMDYGERADFNNPLLVSSAVGGLWMALTGVWLLFASVRPAQFVPVRLRRRASVKLVDGQGVPLREVAAAAGDTVYRALARAGLQLPSNCGGGGSCGLCGVRCAGHAPAPTAADRAHLSPRKLEAGMRLACMLPVQRGVDVDVGLALAAMPERTGVVTKVLALTPFLREVTVRPAGPLACRPGAYVQIHVPAFRRSADDLAIPEHHRAHWQALDLPPELTNAEPVRRAYSVAVPLERCGGQLTFLVRFVAGTPAGRGCSYMYTLKPGDEVRFSGPFGDFALRPGTRPKVFIGGGAGMAPLRAMLHECLARGAGEPLHFWYGARSLADAPYVDEMRAFARLHPNFQWQLVLSEEAGAAGTHSGLVHELVLDRLLRRHADPGSLEFYVCGPPGMLAATRAMLRDLGVKDEDVAYDDFKI